MKVGYVYDPIYLKHDTGAHPENARRLEAIITRLEETGLRKVLVSIAPRPASIEEVALVHDVAHINHVRQVAEGGGGWLDADTPVSPLSYEAALYAAGGTIKAAEAVMDGTVNSAFALVRPPGHHAVRNQGMGFCLFNNVAIATRYALQKYQLERIAIIDFDVHHGNGTQEAFYNESRVLYISTHQYPFYPGTGGIEEVGAGEGRGTNLNIPLPSGCGDNEYARAFAEIIVPAVRRFQPQLIMVSAGYDAHWADELAMMAVTVTGFARMVATIKALADEFCSGRMVFGLDLDALAASVKATFDILMDNSRIDDPLGESSVSRTPDITSLIEKIKQTHHLT